MPSPILGFFLVARKKIAKNWAKNTIRKEFPHFALPIFKKEKKHSTYLFWQKFVRHTFFLFWPSYIWHAYGTSHWLSSIASPICQEGQSGRTFLIFAFSSQFFLFFFLPWFFLIFSLFSPTFGNFFALRGGTLPPLTSQWLRHCTGYKTVYLCNFDSTVTVCYRVPCPGHVVIY